MRCRSTEMDAGRGFRVNKKHHYRLGQENAPRPVVLNGLARFFASPAGSSILRDLAAVQGNPVTTLGTILPRAC